MSEVSTTLSTLAKGAGKIYDVLSDFSPVLERVEIEYDQEEVELHFEVEVPENPVDRFGNNVELERPLDYTFNNLISKRFEDSIEVVESDGDKYQIPVKNLNPGHKYKIVIEGPLTKSAVDDLIDVDKHNMRVTRKKFEQKVVYQNGAVTWDEEPTTIIQNYTDEFDFDHNYIPKRIRESIPTSTEKIHSESWTTKYDPDSGISDSSLDHDELPEIVVELLSSPSEDADWWFSDTVMADYVTIEGGLDYFDLRTNGAELPVPRSFVVISRTNFGEGQGMTDAKIIFEKEEYWNELHEKLTPER